MTTRAPGDFIPVPLGKVEAELAGQIQAEQDEGAPPILRARMSNLVIYGEGEAAASRIAEEVTAIVEEHPARVLLLESVPDAPDHAVAASVRVPTRYVGGIQEVGSEQILLRAEGRGADRLPSIVRSLLIGDLPTNLWWAAGSPPASAGTLLYSLAERAQQLIYDSGDWPDAPGELAAAADWLPRFEQAPERGRWRIASDVNWRRLKSWRRILTQALGPAACPDVLKNLAEVSIEHGPGGGTRAWLLAGWLAHGLNWSPSGGRERPGGERSWIVPTGSGTVRLSLRALPDGPADVRRVRFAAGGESPCALEIVPEDSRRLAIIPEGIEEAAHRTVAVEALSRAALVARQLSDREPDPTFRATMACVRALVGP